MVPSPSARQDAPEPATPHNLRSSDTASHELAPGELSSGGSSSSGSRSGELSSSGPSSSGQSPFGIDPRGPRFGAALTALILAVSLILGPSAGLPLLIIQALAFAVGAFLGLAFQPWGWIYRVTLRRFLPEPRELEDPRPPRFAQAVGLAFAVVGLIGGIAGIDLVFYSAVGCALVAALLNAIFDFCMGCEMYVLGVRLRSKITFVRRWAA